MSVARITEINAAGSSVENAIQNGVERAAKTLQNIEQIWVKDIKARVNEAAEFAQTSPEPDPSEIWTDVRVEA